MAKWARISGLGTALLLTSACVSIDPESVSSNIDTPPSWAALSSIESGATTKVTDDWLADLQDPIVTMLVAEAITNNNDLAATAARVRATRERVGITRAQVLPTLGGSLSGTTSKTPAGVVFDQNKNQNISTPAINESFSLGFNLSWELDVWGRLTDQTRAAYLGAEAARLDLASTQLSIAGATAQAFYALTESRLQRQLSERDVGTGEANLRIIERRYDRGISSSLDVRLARSSLASSQATLIARQQAEQEAARRLEVILGRYPAAAIAASEALPQPAIFQAGQTGVGTPSDILLGRPDVIAAERRLKAAGLDAAAARKALLPSISLSGAAQQFAGGLDDIAFDWSDSQRSLTASLFQPLFQGGRLRAQARAARNDMEAVAFNYASTMLTAYEEVENALAAERFLTAQYEARKIAFEEAEASEDLTERQYLSGTTNIFNLISAQQRRITAESQYINASRQRLSNRINLYLALGASFEVPEDFSLSPPLNGNGIQLGQTQPDQVGDPS